MKKILKGIVLINAKLKQLIWKKPMKKIKSLKNKFKNKFIKYLLLKIYFPYIYRKYAKKPLIENKVIFVEARHPQITNSFQVIYNELVAKYDFDIHSHFLKNIFCKKHEYVQRCYELIKDMATAKYIFLNDACDVVSCVNLRPATQVIQLWHGCGAFKKFGFSTAKLIFGATKKQMLKYPNYKNLSLVTVSSPEVIWAYEEAMGLDHKDNIVQATGISRTDLFYEDNFIQQAYQKLYRLFPQANGKKVILYAPTFRGRVAKGYIDNLLNIKLFKKELGDDYVLISKHHPFVRKCPGVPKDCHDFAKDFTKIMSIEELICVSDICISDYSSLIYEFSLFEKPMIFYAYDLANYFDWRGFYYNYEELTPGPIYDNNLDMINYIKQVKDNFDPTAIQQFKEKFMASCDGNSTNKILNQVFKDDLNKYRRLKELPKGNYHEIPESKFYYSRMRKKINNLAEKKADLQNKYSLYRSLLLKENQVAILTSSHQTYITDYLYNVLSSKYDVLQINVKELAANMQYLASSKFIFTTYNYKELQCLDLRTDTKVIRITDETFCLEKFNYDNYVKEVDYFKEYQKVLPLNYAYDQVLVTNQEQASIYAKAMNIPLENCVVVGSLRLKMLQDEQFIQQSRSKLLNKIDNLGNKKIILYTPYKYRMDNNSNANSFIDYKLMYEYLKNDYVILVHYGTKKMRKREKINAFYQNFIFDCTNDFSSLELEALANIVLGDYRMELIESSLANKKTIVYTPDHLIAINKLNLYYDFDELNFGLRINNSDDLIETILAIDDFDFKTKQQNFREIQNINDQQLVSVINYLQNLS